MSLAIAALLVGLAAGLALGGKPSRLAAHPLRLPAALAAGAISEVVGDRWVSGDTGLGLVVGGYLLLVAFAAANVRTVGMVLVLVGLASNLSVITVDGGMPVRGLAPGTDAGGRHHAETASDRLTGLADVVAVPAIDEHVSAGDIVLSMGVATVVAAGMIVPGSSSLRRRRPSTLT